MATATITSKGQVTIPIEIRDSLHLCKGDKIEILLNDRGEAIMRPVSKKVGDLFGILKNQQQKTLSIEEIDEAVKTKMKNFN